MLEFEQIYSTYFKDVFLYVKGLAGDESLAEEITEETFFKAMQGLSSFGGRCDIRVWLCQIAKNSFYTYCKRRKRLVDDSSLATLSDDCRIAENFADKELALQIHRFLHEMSGPYKEVFSLRVFGELSFQQIGDIFGKTEGWARVTYHRAKSKIQDYMEVERDEQH